MRERADALRNQAAVLAAAEVLFDREDLEHVSLSRIAERAGVGKATVLRRFGDMNGLIEAVIAPHVTALRTAIHEGRAPLGPGGDPAERLHAYLDALLDFVLANRALIRALEKRGPYAYYANPASQFWIEELDRRIVAACPSVDAEYLANIVFTALRADVIDHLRHNCGMTTDRVRAGLHSLVTAATAERPVVPPR